MHIGRTNLRWRTYIFRGAEGSGYHGSMRLSLLLSLSDLPAPCRGAPYVSARVYVRVKRSEKLRLAPVAAPSPHAQAPEHLLSSSF
eukprot:161559-Rhodomonas_salina.1